MSFVERVDQGESLTSWLNWFTEPPAVRWSVIMGDVSPIWKEVYWTLPEALRTGPPGCAVHSTIYHTQIGVAFVCKPYVTIQNSTCCSKKNMAVLACSNILDNCPEIWKWWQQLKYPLWFIIINVINLQLIIYQHNIYILSDFLDYGNRIKT